MCEIWKDIIDYEGLYQVSNFGRIKSLERYDNRKHKIPERIMKTKGNDLGYKRVCLCRDGKIERRSVHRIVAEAFVKRDNENYNIVNHLDNDPSNNRADNLEWTTYKGNMQWAAKQGRMKANAQAYKNFESGRNKRKKAVIATAPDGKKYTFESQGEAGRVLGVNACHIAQVCRKEYGYTNLKGYTFEYVDQELQKSLKPKRQKMTKEERSAFISNLHKGNKYCVGKKCSEAAKQATRELHSKPIVQMDKSGNEIAMFSSVADAEEKTKIRHANDVANGKRKSAGGYLWKWKERE